MVVRIPTHALTLGSDPVFRGEWRGEDVLYAREDFSSGVIPEGLVVWKGPNPAAGEAQLITPDVVSLAYDGQRSPAGVPGYRMLRLTHSDATQGVTYSAELHLSALGLPSDLTVTRVEFHVAHGTTTNSGGMSRFRGYIDGYEVTRPSASSAMWELPVRHSTASLSPASVIDMRFVAYNTSVATAGLFWYLADLKVYGTLEPAYRFGDSVTWGGKVWQSTINNNNDVPGTTSRWADLTPQVPTVPRVGNLADVDQSVPLTDGMVLRYDAATQKWVPSPS